MNTIIVKDKIEIPVSGNIDLTQIQIPKAHTILKSLALFVL